MLTTTDVIEKILNIQVSASRKWADCSGTHEKT